MATRVAMMFIAVLCLGCASKRPHDAAPATVQPQGVLMQWSSQPLMGSAREWFEMDAAEYSRMPADVVIESKTDSQLVLTMDFAKVGRALAPRSDPASTETIPVRYMSRVVDVAGKPTVQTHIYYLGKDEKVLAAIKREVEQRAAAGDKPPDR